jgi:hypothetical protein
VVSAYQKLEETHVPDLKVFVDLQEYDYFCDLVHARTGKLPTRRDGGKRDRALAQASVALAAGDLDEAEKALPQVVGGVAENDRLAERYRGAVALGRKLKAEGAVILSPQQVKDLCVGANEPLWTVEGDKLTGHKLQGVFDLTLPLGLQNAVVSGVLTWEGDIAAVEIQLHARAPRRKERAIFHTADNLISLHSDGKVLTNAPYEPGPQKFRVDLGADEDRLEPCPGVRWRLPTDDLPGCFALILWNRDNSTLSISDLRIELKK